MAPDADLIAAIANLFRTDPVLVGLLGGRFYDRVPAKAAGELDAATDYVSVGAVDSVPQTIDCIEADDVTLQLDVWSAAYDRDRCRTIVAAIRRRLHDAELPLAENGLAACVVALTRIFEDPDGVTLHGVVQVTASIDLT